MFERRKESYKGREVGERGGDTEGEKVRDSETDTQKERE